jgi:hypothetical protein
MKTPAFLRRFIKSKQSVYAVLALAVATLLYLAGFTWAFAPVMVVVMALALPYPGVFRSLFSRLIVSGLLFYSFLQLASLVQFLTLPQTGFAVIALLTFVLALCAVVALAPLSRNRPMVYADRKDAAAVLTAAFFLVPLAVLCFGSKGLLHTAQLGGIEGIDATNHFAITAEMTQAQHLTYRAGDYYPKGFHIATGFIQDSLHIRQSDQNWTTNATLFISQYLVFGGLLAYTLFYLGRALVEVIGQQKRMNDFWLALSIGPALTLIYLLPFVNDGFLSYYYICATVAMALVCMISFYEEHHSRQEDFVFTPLSRWFMVAYFLLIVGASMSWPLLIPPLMLIPLLYLLPSAFKNLRRYKKLLTWQNVPLVLVALIQFVPIYFQLKYSDSSATDSITLSGGIHIFHFGVVILGLVLAVYLSLTATVSDAFKRFTNNVFWPLYIFLGGLMALQYFLIGELRYYSIKSAYLIEMFVLVVLVVWLLHLYEKSTLPRFSLLAVPVLTVTAFMALIGLTGNPIKETRDLLRNYSHEVKPQYFDQDVKEFVELGERGDIKNTNVTLLHYDQDKKKLFAHMQIPYWANMMSYSGRASDTAALHCNGHLYSNLLFGTFTDKEQQDLIRIVRACAAMARQHGGTYYIVTDDASEPIIKQLFGDVAEVK